MPAIELKKPRFGAEVELPPPPPGVTAGVDTATGLVENKWLPNDVTESAHTIHTRREHARVLDILEVIRIGGA